MPMVVVVDDDDDDETDILVDSIHIEYLNVPNASQLTSFRRC